MRPSVLRPRRQYRWCAPVASADGALPDPCDLSATKLDALGDGTAASPYVICTPAQWIDLANTSSAWASNFRIGRDIDLTAVPGDHPTVGNDLTPFSGVVDGNQKVISGYTTSSSPQHTGLFGNVDGPAAAIRHLAVKDARIVCFATCGALVGYLAQGIVEDAASFGDCSITNGWANHKGGLIGETAPAASIQNVFSTCTVNGIGIGIAGLIGHHEGTLTNAYYQNETNPVSGTTRVGGLIGWNLGTTSNAFTTVAVNGDDVGSADIALCIGTFGGTAANVWYDSSRAVINASGGGTTANGNAIDTATAPGYFESRANPPLDSWDFDQIWLERPGKLPVLRWLDGRI